MTEKQRNKVKRRIIKDIFNRIVLFELSDSICYSYWYKAGEIREIYFDSYMIEPNEYGRCFRNNNIISIRPHTNISQKLKGFKKLRLSVPLFEDEGPFLTLLKNTMLAKMFLNRHRLVNGDRYGGIDFGLLNYHSELYQ